MKQTDYITQADRQTRREESCDAEEGRGRGRGRGKTERKGREEEGERRKRRRQVVEERIMMVGKK